MAIRREDGGRRSLEQALLRRTQRGGNDGGKIPYCLEDFIVSTCIFKVAKNRQVAFCLSVLSSSSSSSSSSSKNFHNRHHTKILFDLRF